MSRGKITAVNSCVARLASNYAQKLYNVTVIYNWLGTIKKYLHFNQIFFKRKTQIILKNYFQKTTVFCLSQLRRPWPVGFQLTESTGGLKNFNCALFLPKIGSSKILMLLKLLLKVGPRRIVAMYLRKGFYQISIFEN